MIDKLVKLISIISFIVLAVSCDSLYAPTTMYSQDAVYELSEHERESMEIAFGADTAHRLLQEFPIFWSKDVPDDYSAMYSPNDRAVYVHLRYRGDAGKKSGFEFWEVVVHEYVHAWMYSSGWTHENLKTGVYRVDNPLTVKTLGHEGTATAFQLSVMLYRSPTLTFSMYDGGSYNYDTWIVPLGQFIARYHADTAIPKSVVDAYSHRMAVSGSSRGLSTVIPEMVAPAQ